MIIISIGILIIMYIIFQFNKINLLKNKVKQSKSGIDVYLSQRFELIPNLVECVKAYSTYESELLKDITELRSKYNNTKDLKSGTELNNKFNECILLNEKYPELKSNENYLNLQKNLSKMESQLQAARRVYNSNVTMYNTAIMTFPGLIFAKVFSFKEVEFFEIESNKKENIEVKDLEV